MPNTSIAFNNICETNLDANSGKIAVVFSSANANSFTYFKTFAQFKDLKIIFLRDPYLNTWYLNGTNEKYNTWQLLIELLSSNLAGYRHENISFWGSSMGGYAALKAAKHFEGSFCLALSPQTILDSRLPHNVPKELAIEKHTFNNLSFDTRNKGSYHIVGGGADLVDMYYIAKSLVPRERFFPLFGGDHLSSALLHKIGFINSAIDNWLNYGEVDLPALASNHGHKPDTCFYNSDYLQLTVNAVENYYFHKNNHLTLETLDKMLVRFPNPGAFMLKGAIIAKSGSLNECISCYDQAFTHSLTKLEPAKQLGKILYQHKMYDRSIEYLNLALQSRHNDYDSLCLMAENQIKIGDTSKALFYLKDAAAIRPNSTRADKIAELNGLNLKAPSNE